MSCERIDKCKNATIKGVSCKRYKNISGYPCKHEASYWSDGVENYFNGSLDEKHRFPLYKKGDIVYHIPFSDSFFVSEVLLDRIKVSKICVYSDPIDSREGWCYEINDEFYPQYELFNSEKEAIDFAIKYINSKILKLNNVINKLKNIIND